MSTRPAPSPAHRGGDPAGARPERRRAPADAGPDPLDEFFWRADEPAPAALELLAPAMARASGSAEVPTEWLAVRLAGEEYGVAIEAVREILKAPAVTEVPRAPAHVLGVIIVRGEVIAVVDPRRLLRLPPAPPGPRSRVVVCDAGDGPVGLLVDAVSDVVRLARGAVEPRPPGVGGEAAEHVAGIGRTGERLVLLLELRALLAEGGAPRRPEASP